MPVWSEQTLGLRATCLEAQESSSSATVAEVRCIQMFTQEGTCRNTLSRSINKILLGKERPYCFHAGLRFGLTRLTTTVSTELGGESDFKEEKAFGGVHRALLSLSCLRKGALETDRPPVPLFYLRVWLKFYKKPLKSSLSVLQVLWHSHTSDPSKQTPAYKYRFRHTGWGFQTQAIISTPCLAPMEISFPPWLSRQLCQKSETTLQPSLRRSENLPTTHRC